MPADQDPPAALRALAEDLKADADAVDGDEAAGVREGLGRAAGRATERAKNLEQD
jgi:hypothetical protein